MPVTKIIVAFRLESIPVTKMNVALRVRIKIHDEISRGQKKGEMYRMRLIEKGLSTRLRRERETETEIGTGRQRQIKKTDKQSCTLPASQDRTYE